MKIYQKKKAMLHLSTNKKPAGNSNREREASQVSNYGYMVTLSTTVPLLMNNTKETHRSQSVPLDNK